MFQLFFIMFILFLVMFIYTYIINRFTKKYILFYVPTILGIVWYIFQLLWYFTKTTEGIQDLGIYIATMFIAVIIFSNVLMVFIFKKRK